MSQILVIESTGDIQVLELVAGGVGAGGGGGGSSAWGGITGTLSAQTDLQAALDAKQASNAALTSISGLTPSNDDVLQRKAGAWINRTPAQLKADLLLAKADVGLVNVDNTSDVNKPVSTAQANADTAVLATAQSYADGLVVGLWDDRGNFSAAANTWPSTGGSGSAGAIKKGDTWTISVVGTLGGHIVDVGDVIRALVDAPGTTDSNWAIQEHNLGYTAENSANKDATGGYAGLTLLKLNLRNVVNTITSWFTNANTVARTYTLPDKDGTVAMLSDITGTNSGTNTGDQTITLTGDVTGSGTGSFATTAATVNSNVGTFTTATITVDGKGRITAASTGAGGGGSPGGSGSEIQFRSGASTFGAVTGSSVSGAAVTLKGAATTGAAVFTVTPSAGTSSTRINDNGTMVLDSDVGTGSSIQIWKYNGTQVGVFDYQGTLSAVKLNVNGGFGGFIKSGSNGQVNAYNVLELSTGVGGTGTKVQINNGTLDVRRDLDLRCLLPQVFTVATLPIASTQGNGARSHVSDALTPTFGATVAGSGAVSTPVYSDAANWKVG